MDYLEILTEWCRNKPEEAAKRILELESDSAEPPLQVTPKEPARERPPTTDWVGVTRQPCGFCKTVHPPTMECPRYWMN